MTCPNCKAVSADDAAECSGCGVIFAKLKARTESRAATASVAASPAPGTSSGAPLGSLLIGLLLLGAGFGWWKYKDAQSGAAVRTETVKGGNVSPEPYKAEIVALERALRGDGSIELTAGKLEGRLFMNPMLRGSPKSEGIAMALAGMGGDVPIGGGPAVSDQLRHWEAARDEFFVRAPWFAENVLTAAPGTAVDMDASVAALKKCLGDASQLIESARVESAQYGDEEVNLQSKDPSEKARLEDWRAWHAAWRSRVQSAAACLPAPTATPANLGEARRFVVQILGTLAAPPNPGPGVFLGANDPAINAVYLPRKSDREGWLNNTKSWVQQCSAVVDASAKR